MNTLILGDVFWEDYVGGITQSLSMEAKELLSRGHKIVVVARTLMQCSPFHESKSGCEVFRYRSPLRGSPLYRMYPLASIKRVPELVSHIDREFAFDVAYVHNPFQAVGLLKSPRKIPYVYVFHAPTPREIEIEARKGKYGFATPFVGFVNRWVRKQEAKAISQACKILVRSQYMEEEMLQLYQDIDKNKIFCIPLGVDLQRFSFVARPVDVRMVLCLPRERPILFTVRRLVARMGLENLLLAVKEVTREVPEVLLIIGGRGYLENTLREQVNVFQLEHNVKFIGFVPEEMLPLYYQSADLFVLPTEALEGFGLVTVEALSCGTPVVATPIGANLEVLKGLGKEFLSRDASPEALAERILWFLKEGNRPELRWICRRYCEENFDIVKVVDSIEQLLFSAIRK